MAAGKGGEMIPPLATIISPAVLHAAINKTGDKMRHGVHAILAMTAAGLLLGSFNACATASSPQVFAPGVISDSIGSMSPAFAPDGKTVYVMRNVGHGFKVMQSRQLDRHWSPPVMASFSGHWRDLDPAMAPDGAYLVFVSNRPATPNGKAIDATSHGKRRPGKGMNLWRVDRQGDGWGVPVRLPDAVNRCHMTFAPTVTADGSLYFIGCGPSGALRLQRSQYDKGHYQTPVVVKLGGTNTAIRDPAIAPDESFIVFSSKPANSKQPYRIHIAFRKNHHWTRPIDLGDAVNQPGNNMANRLGPDHRTLYFSAGNKIWKVSLAPWLNKHETGGMSDKLTPLAWFLGQWHCQGEFPNGKSIHSTETFSPMLDGHWLRMQHHDAPPHSYDAVEWWGYDTAKKRFIVDVYDNAGGVRQYTSPGWSDDTLNLENIATKGYVDRFAFRRLGNSRYQIAYDHKNAPGPWKHGDVLTCTRIHAPSTHS